MNSKQQEKPHHHNHAYFIPVDNNHVSILGNTKTRKSFSTLQNKNWGSCSRDQRHPMPTHHISSLSIIWSSDNFSLQKHLNLYNWQNNHGMDEQQQKFEVFKSSPPVISWSRTLMDLQIIDDVNDTINLWTHVIC